MSLDVVIRPAHGRANRDSHAWQRQAADRNLELIGGAGCGDRNSAGHALQSRPSVVTTVVVDNLGCSKRMGKGRSGGEVARCEFACAAGGRAVRALVFRTAYSRKCQNRGDDGGVEE